jgi:PAS domain S-box-containing protein
VERKERFDASTTPDGRYRMLVEAVTDYAIYMLDRDGIITSWNPGAKRFKGYEESEILGESFSRFYTDEDRRVDLPKRALEIAEREGKFESEGWRVRKDGTKFWAYVVIDPIRDPTGEVVGFAKVTRDLTERMNAQRILDETREALTQAQKMEAIGHLTGGIAHDFNNLLMAIQGSLELLQRRLPKEDPKVAQLLDNAIQGAQRGAALTQRMLAFARRQELKLVGLSVPEIVQGMTELLQSSLGPSIQIETHFPMTLAKAYADPHQLELAILNLAVNARDAMPKGGAIVIGAKERNVTDEPALKPGHYLCVTVTDTGAGMDEATLKRAMEPFFTTKGVGKGTGLGLPMVHGMAQQSGGKLVLKSKCGLGTTAELYLPVASADAASAKGESSRRMALSSARKLAILTVDDDPLVALNTSALLEELGHTVYSASSGPRALEILRHEAGIDLLITDQAMPGMTGSELASIVRAENPEFPVILATGYAELHPGEGLGIPRLAKPFRQQDLADAIAEAITN